MYNQINGALFSPLEWPSQWCGSVYDSNVIGSLLSNAFFEKILASIPKKSLKACFNVGDFPSHHSSFLFSGIGGLSPGFFPSPLPSFPSPFFPDSFNKSSSAVLNSCCLVSFHSSVPLILLYAAIILSFQPGFTSVIWLVSTIASKRLVLWSENRAL